MYGGVRWPDTRLHEVQGHTVRVLVVSQALGGLGMSIGIAVAPLLAEQVSGSEKLAGLAQTMQVLGAAIASFLLAHLMGRRGRRVGLSVGYTLGASGAALAGKLLLPQEAGDRGRHVPGGPAEAIAPPDRSLAEDRPTEPKM